MLAENSPSPFYLLAACASLQLKMVSQRELGGLLWALLLLACILTSLTPTVGANPGLGMSLLEDAAGNSEDSQRWRRDMQFMESIDDEDLYDGNCSQLEDYPSYYNDTCEFVKDQCNDHELFNYLQFAVCDLGKVFGFIFHTVWLFYLLLLLSSTVSAFYI